MEKQGVVIAGKTPSEETGVKSAIVKNGKAFGANEADNITEKKRDLQKRCLPAIITSDNHYHAFFI